MKFCTMTFTPRGIGATLLWNTGGVFRRRSIYLPQRMNDVEGATDYMDILTESFPLSGFDLD